MGRSASVALLDTGLCTASKKTPQQGTAANLTSRLHGLANLVTPFTCTQHVPRGQTASEQVPLLTEYVPIIESLQLATATNSHYLST